MVRSLGSAGPAMNESKAKVRIRSPTPRMTMLTVKDEDVEMTA